jgi:type I restriction enzyme S subunit
MIYGLTPYPGYTDSGEPWLGPVPRGWEMRRTKTLLRERSDKGHPDEPLLAATQSKGVVRKEDYENRTVLALKDLQLLKLVREGDFVISLRSFQGGIEYARHQGIISPAYTVLHPTDPETHGYLAWLFKSRPYVENLSLHVTGIRQGQNIDYERLARSRLPVPPPEERGRISCFLAYADRRIRRYIAAKNRLVRLLEEQEQAIVHRAVTRGLDPSVRLKPSGVDWLGEVPEHWDVQRISASIVSVTAGLWGEDPSQANSLDHIVCVRVADFDMSRMEVRRSRLTTRALPPRARESRRLLVGDLLIEKSGGGDAEPVGRVVRYSLSQPSVCSNFVARLRPKSTMVRSDYLLYVLSLLQSTRRNIPSIKQTTGIQNLDLRHYLANMAAFPPLHEQDAILAGIEASISGTRKAKEQAQLEIDLVREYRTRLIADVVTGKLDVREAAAWLPDEVEEPEPPELAEALAEGDESEDEMDLNNTGVEVGA